MKLINRSVVYALTVFDWNPPHYGNAGMNWREVEVTAASLELEEQRDQVIQSLQTEIKVERAKLDIILAENSHLEGRLKLLQEATVKSESDKIRDLNEQEQEVSSLLKTKMSSQDTSDAHTWSIPSFRQPKMLTGGSDIQSHMLREQSTTIRSGWNKNIWLAPAALVIVLGVGLSQVR